VPEEVRILVVLGEGLKLVIPGEIIILVPKRC